MAKHVILEAYTFTPSTRTIAITGKNIRREQLLLITNTTTNTVIYNFSDPDLKATSYVNAVNSTTGQESTTIVLNYNTTSMASTDVLAIVTEETYQEIIPSETMRDPVDKMRVSTPQALIDTDFEYGTQPTKWDSTALLNGRSGAYYDATSTMTITNVTGSTKTVTITGNKATFTATSTTTVLTVTAITTGVLQIGDVVVGTGITGTITSYGSNTAGGAGTYNISGGSNQAVAQSCTATPGVGTPIFVLGTLDTGNADGWWVIDTSTGTAVTYIAYNTPAATLYDSQKTYVFPAFWYTGAGIPVSASANTAFTSSGTTVTGTTTNAHGLRVGDGIHVVGTTATTNPPNGSWVVATTPTNNTFTFVVNNAPTGSNITPTFGTTGTLYPRLLGYVAHRAFDGGVQFSNVAPNHGYQVFRQTRRQFRYQSGKAVQFSTGSILKPGFNVDSITNSASSTTITVTTKTAHGLGVGCFITVTGCNETVYNGTFTVASVPTPTTFTYSCAANGTPGGTSATGFYYVFPSSWYGNSNRLGMFDHQNGFFFEFDGQTIWAVKRSSTTQIAGAVTATNGSQSVTGSNTKFASQLKPNDWIVIRGMSYQVLAITSDTQMYIYPEYRGATTATNSTVVSKTIDTRYAGPSTQSGVTNVWNIDKMDGTGHSRMNLDLSKMQMFYADYTWYGAGAIRFGFKNNRGEVIYCHRIPNNNVNTEAYMRSGNLVARYEINHMPIATYLTTTLSNTATTGATISVGDVTTWPSSGTVVLTQGAATGGTIEYITYSAKVGTTGLTIASRAQTGGAASAQTFTVTSAGTGYVAGTTNLVSAELYSPQCASTISHWGSSVIMDGRYDDDKSLVFNAGNNTATSNLAQNVRVPILSIRIAPSIDNGLTGALGAREIINRMQLTLRQMDAYTSGTAFRIDVILNGQLSGGTWQAVGGSSLAQVAYHNTSSPFTTISGGESIFGFFTSNSGSVTQDLSIVRDIGTAIFGGGTNNNVSTSPSNKFPDGPDVITICATNITNQSTNTINSRLSWTEAQA